MVDKAQIADLLLEARQSDVDRSVKAQAAKIGIAPKTITEIRDGEYYLEAQASARKKVGMAKTLARIYDFLNRRGKIESSFTLEEALYAFGLDPEDKSAIYSAHEEIRPGYVETGDPVLEDIFKRKRRSTQGASTVGINVGLIPWGAIFKKGENAGESWAWRYCRQLLGAINPLEWELIPSQINELSEAVTSLGSGANNYDLVFGLYDTPYRRLKGLRFITIPGIGIPISIAGCFELDTIWKDLANSSTKSALEQPIAMVVSEEVGHLWLAGTCGLPAANLKILPASNLTAAVTAMEKAINLFGNEKVILCADSTYVNSFADKVAELLAAGKITSDAMSKFKIADTDENITPIYRLGIGVRADAKEWFKLLRDAQLEEMFRNAKGRTAQAYFQLFTGSKDYVVLPLSYELPPAIALPFADSLKELIPKDGHSDRSKKLRKDIDKKWLAKALPDTKQGHST